MTPLTIDQPPRILVIEDDTSLREGLRLNFELQGYEVATAADGREGLRLALLDEAELIVLDIMLPGRSGLEVLAEVRGRGLDVPVLILSARSSVPNKIEGLRDGADDYVTKPFELPELLARVEAQLRRVRQRRRPGARRFGDLVIDLELRQVQVRGQRVELGAREFDILALLAGAPGRPFSREEILQAVWGAEFDGTSRTVDNFIVMLRQKLEADPSRPRYIRTVRQVGYKLEA